jgi:glycosyltransferase involved in cell wall biosynthesis
VPVVEEAKGTAELIDHFFALQDADPKPRTLVLIGPIAMAIPDRRDARALGQVTDREQWDALAAATIVCVPWAYESLSLAALEAWSVESPIIANGGSPVLVGQCRRANGGLWYANQSEFVELARTSLFGLARELGADGRAYLRTHYTWDNVRTALRDLAFPPA